MTESGSTNRFVVTGAAGFLGSHLCEALLRRGHEVIGVDDLSSGRRCNLADFARHPSFSLREADVNDGIPVRGHVDGVFHLICPRPAVSCAPDHVNRLPAPPTGIEQITEFSQRRRTRLLLVGATGEEYEDPFDGATAVDSIPSRWSEHDRNRERDGHRDRRLAPVVDLRIARLFSAYGPRMEPEDEPTLTHLLLQAVTGQPMSVNGSPTQTRSFCFVSDLINGMLKLFRSDLAGRPVDLGDPTEHRIEDIATEIRRATGTQAQAEYRPGTTDPARRPRPDIALATDRLGWAPRVPLAAGLQATARWMQAELGPTVGHGLGHGERRSA